MIVKKEEYLGLKYRIEELENILCPPSKGHDWKEIEDVYQYGPGPEADVLIGKKCQCTRCLKKKFVSF